MDQLFINGSWVDGKGLPFSSRNSATGEIVWEGAAATDADVDLAVQSANDAFEAWSALSLDARIQYVEAFGNALKKSFDSLAEIISQETGKPLWESKTEVQSMLGKVAISIEAYKQRCPEIRHTLPAGLSLTRHHPHGVVAVFGPFNFPGHLPNGHMIPALIAGNTVVFKPSELTPATAEKIISCWQEINLPSGVLNLIQGGRDTGAALAAHSGIDGLFFTGSWATGRSFLEQFSVHPQKILALEMGGNNPLVVTKVKDLKAAAFLTTQSAYLTAGQRCTCARRLILLEGAEGNTFLQTLLHMIKHLHVGIYIQQPEPFMGPVISSAAAQRLLKAQEELQEAGGISLEEMRLLKPETNLLSPGLMDVTAIAGRKDEELFGPFLQVIRVPDFQEAIREANQTSFGLSAGLLSDSKEEFEEFHRKIKAGIINWNSPTTGASSAAPFGGIKHSGNHRPSAFYAADYCSYPVASIINEQLSMPEAVPPGCNF